MQAVPNVHHRTATLVLEAKVETMGDREGTPRQQKIDEPLRDATNETMRQALLPGM